MITMKRWFLILIISLSSTVSVAQKSNQIKYVLPDNVEVHLDSCVKDVDSKKLNFYFVLRKNVTYSISIGTYSKRESKNILRWVKQSNRYLVVNDKTYPLIFDYDLEFGAMDSDNSGSFRNREGNIKRVNLILHGLTIEFSADGKILRFK